MRHELIDRYIYDVTKTYSKSERERIRNEIATDIDIKLNEFGDEDSVTDQQIKEVLIELGTSKDIAKKYAKDGDIALISQPYYGQYKKMMWVGIIIASLWILAFNAFDLIVRQGVTSFGSDMITVIIRAVESILISGFAIYSINTMAFSILSKEKSNPRKTS
ncbi:MAG: hypothetical protein GXZ08_04605 [Tissierellia bacterium]|nr:hypothetical protein [Tissierellia bacterium]